MVKKSSLSLATDPKNTKGRLYKENEPLYRSPFQRDRDRIIHSTAFRRLEYKTQVFVNHEGDHYRTRLTHSIEVAQIARTLATSLGLDIYLAEAIALAHDLGHTPFGHAGEDALKEVYPAFDHNAQSIKILTKLERKYAEFDGLNLTWETLEGIAKHNGPLAKPGKAILEYNRLNNLDLQRWPSLEAQIAALADDIAYVNHDLDDGLRAGLFDIEDIKPLPLVGDILAKVMHKYPNLEKPRLIHETNRRILSAMIEDLMVETKLRIGKYKIEEADDVRDLKHSTAAFSALMMRDVRVIKDWLYKNMYRHYKVNRMTSKAHRIVTELYGFFLNEPECLPTEWQKKIGAVNLEEVIADYIAGMTDRFAIQEYDKLFDVKP